MAHQCHITQLTIPVDLMRHDHHQRGESTRLLKRAETTLKQTKGVFTELSRHSGVEHVPRQIVFVLADRVQFNAVREKLQNIFACT
jgi:hypothetical protein